VFAFTLKAALFHDHHRLHLIAHADAMVESLLPSPLVNAAKSCTSLAGVPTPREDGEVQYQYLSSHQQCRVVVSFYQFNLLSINVNEANNFLHDNRAEHFQEVFSVAPGCTIYSRNRGPRERDETKKLH
jgi:hypothetical protein